MAAAMTIPSSTAPPIPPRHPGRLHRTSTYSMPPKDEPATAGEQEKKPIPDYLPSKQVKSWERAALLYHSYDWQAAADEFLSLSRTIARPLEANLCLINAALILARLDDFEAAARLLEEAEAHQPTSALTMFILGHIEFEQGNFEKSEECFKVTLSQLKSSGDYTGSIQEFQALGMDYVLRPWAVNQNLRVLETKNSVFGVLGTLSALPANLIFEAPVKWRMCFPELSRRDSVGSDETPTLTDLSISSCSTSPVENYLEDDQDDMWSHVATDYLHPAIRDSGFPRRVEDINETIARAPAPANTNTYQLPEIYDGKRSQGFVRQPSMIQPLQPASLRRRSNLVPRDARLQDNTVGALSSFIRGLPSQNVREARNAEAKSDSVWDMARFFQDGPEAHTRNPYFAEEEEYSASSDDDRGNNSTTRPGGLTSEDLLQMAESVNNKAISPLPRHPYRSGLGDMLIRTSSGENLYGSSRPQSSRSRFPRTQSYRSESSGHSIRSRPEIPSRNSSLRRLPSLRTSTPTVTKLDDDDTPTKPKRSTSSRLSTSFFPKRWDKRVAK